MSAAGAAGGGRGGVGAPLVPDGTVITAWLSDDTLHGGPRTVERRWVAPFARASREDDYHAAWA